MNEKTVKDSSCGTSLAEGLVHVEQQLQIPHIAGDLAAWAEGVVHALEAIERPLQDVVDKENPQSYLEIVKAKRTMAAQVDKLREEDQAIVASFPGLMREAEQLASSVREISQAEHQFHATREHLVQRGLAFVLRVRRQRVATETWFGEAMQRVEGGGD